MSARRIKNRIPPGRKIRDSASVDRMRTILTAAALWVSSDKCGTQIFYNSSSALELGPEEMTLEMCAAISDLVAEDPVRHVVSDVVTTAAREFLRMGKVLPCMVDGVYRSAPEVSVILAESVIAAWCVDDASVREFVAEQMAAGLL